MVTRTEVDSNLLSPQVADTLAHQLDRAGVQHMQEPASGQNQPDDLLYEILLDDGGDAVRRRFTDDTLPVGVRRLVDWIDARRERSYAVETWVTRQFHVGSRLLTVATYPSRNYGSRAGVRVGWLTLESTPDGEWL
jgi:hypothetical protein